MVPTSFAELARSLAESFAPVSGAGMFTTPVYAKDGSIPYYASNGNIDDEFASMIDDSTGDTLWAAVQAVGAQIPEYAVRSMMAGSIVRSDCNVLDLIREMDLHGHDDPLNQE